MNKESQNPTGHDQAWEKRNKEGQIGNLLKEIITEIFSNLRQENECLDSYNPKHPK